MSSISRNPDPNPPAEISSTLEPQEILDVPELVGEYPTPDLHTHIPLEKDIPAPPDEQKREQTELMKSLSILK